MNKFMLDSISPIYDLIIISLSLSSTIDNEKLQQFMGKILFYDFEWGANRVLGYIVDKLAL
jgi:hypothetical protein